MRLSQNGMRSDDLIPVRVTLTQVPPVDRQHPPHRVVVVELGKPVVFPCGWAAGVCELQSVRWDSGHGIAEKANAGL